MWKQRRWISLSICFFSASSLLSCFFPSNVFFPCLEKDICTVISTVSFPRFSWYTLSVDWNSKRIGKESEQKSLPHLSFILSKIDPMNVVGRGRERGWRRKWVFVYVYARVCVCVEGSETGRKDRLLSKMVRDLVGHSWKLCKDWINMNAFRLCDVADGFASLFIHRLRNHSKSPLMFLTQGCDPTRESRTKAYYKD